MSRFYGGVQGDKGEATRCGHHGYNAYAQSNTFGIECEYAHGPDNDYGVVYLTAGRYRKTGKVMLGKFDGTTFNINPNIVAEIERFNKENSDE